MFDYTAIYLFKIISDSKQFITVIMKFVNVTLVRGRITSSLEKEVSPTKTGSSLIKD